MTKTVEAILRLSSKLGSMKAFRDLSGHLGVVDRKAQAFNRRQMMIARGAKEMHAMLLRYAAPAALAYGAKEAFVEFAQLERQMTRIGITAGASADETTGALQKVQGMAKQFAMPIGEVISGLDTLVASGMDLKEALDFLPSVTMTAQAAGAATADMANTAQKAASALKIEAADMQRAFDIMVEGGKAGQFEMKDMAAYIPELANSFATLGYDGTEGLKRLVAMLQTIREDTGSASAAATQAQNIFGKMYSGETAGKFKNFGINLRKELDAAKKSGEDVLQAFVRISREAIDGDLSKLPLLFTDQEFRLGMQSLMTSADSYQRFLDTVNSSKVDGSAMRDFGRVVEDNQAKIDRMSASWGRLKQAFGGAVAGPVGGAMDAISTDIDRIGARYRELERRGHKSVLAKEGALLGVTARNLFNPDGAKAELADLEWRGGYRSNEQRRLIETYGVYGKSRASAPDAPVLPLTPRDSFGMPIAGPIPRWRDGGPVAIAEAHRPIVMPTARPSDYVRARDAFDREFATYQATRAQRFRPMPDHAAAQDAIDRARFTPGPMNVLAEAEAKLKPAADTIAEGGERAGRSIAEAGQSVKAGGQDAGSALERGAQAIREAAAVLSRAALGLRGGGWHGCRRRDRQIWPHDG